MNTCEKCPFWDPQGAVRDDQGVHAPCRRHGPQVYAGPQGGNFSTWPRSYSHEWCGDGALLAEGEERAGIPGQQPA